MGTPTVVGKCFMFMVPFIDTYRVLDGCKVFVGDLSKGQMVVGLKLDERGQLVHRVFGLKLDEKG